MLCLDDIVYGCKNEHSNENDGRPNHRVSIQYSSYEICSTTMSIKWSRTHQLNPAAVVGVKMGQKDQKKAQLA
jgi:hypothetical protein